MIHQATDKPINQLPCYLTVQLTHPIDVPTYLLTYHREAHFKAYLKDKLFEAKKEQICIYREYKSAIPIERGVALQ